MSMKIDNPATRRWLYSVALAVIALLVAYGIIDGEHMELWMTLLTALLGVPMVTAIRHIPDAPDCEGRHRRGES